MYELPLPTGNERLALRGYLILIVDAYIDLQNHKCKNVAGNLPLPLKALPISEVNAKHQMHE